MATAVVTAVAEPEVLGPDDDDDDGLGGGDNAEEKRLKRMRRNRESAAQSRNRKKQYVDSLESEIRNLKSTISNLSSENYELRREHARLTGAPPPMAPEALSVVAPLVEPIDDDLSPSGPSGLPPVAIAAHAVSAIAAIDPHIMASSAVAAPSPRKTDALLGLELLSRSASINGAEEEDHAHEGDAAEVMDAEEESAEPAAREDEVSGSDTSGTAAGSTASSMSLGAHEPSRKRPLDSAPPPPHTAPHTPSTLVVDIPPPWPLPAGPLTLPVCHVHIPWHKQTACRPSLLARGKTVSDNVMLGSGPVPPRARSPCVVGAAAGGSMQGACGRRHRCTPPSFSPLLLPCSRGSPLRRGRGGGTLMYPSARDSRERDRCALCHVCVRWRFCRVRCE